MNVLVLDVAADSGGAATILIDFYEKFKTDKSNRYFICVSKIELVDTDNITVLRFPEVKKSWLHRLYFENFQVPKVIRKYHIDSIFSLQNTAANWTNLPQTIYLHQSLPFVEHKFSFKDNRLFWIYQNIISKKIYRSLHKAQKVIVQTNWMKLAVAEKVKISPEKIDILPVQLDAEISNCFVKENWNNQFFYPASNQQYKNHEIILKAASYLVQEGIENFSVLFTISKEQLPAIEKYPKLKNIVQFLGSIPHSEVLEMYTKSLLIFPSYIETVGLPLLEARLTGTPIIASNCVFCHEILEGYDNAVYFDPFSELELFEILKQKIV